MPWISRELKKRCVTAFKRRNIKGYAKEAIEREINPKITFTIEIEVF